MDEKIFEKYCKYFLDNEPNSKMFQLKFMKCINFNVSNENLKLFNQIIKHMNKIEYLNYK